MLLRWCGALSVRQGYPDAASRPTRESAIARRHWPGSERVGGAHRSMAHMLMGTRETVSERVDLVGLTRVKTGIGTGSGW